MNTLIKTAKSVLTSKEFTLFQIMNARAGTLYIEGHPGGGKSALPRSIAKKLKFRYIPIDCPAAEEVDLGLFPKAEGDVVKLLVPEWVPKVMTTTKSENYQGVIISFEEMNRNNRLINGMLNILNERRMGHKIYFDNAPVPIFFCATGNLGEEDGTVVEDLDSAQAGRLIRIRHEIKGLEGLKEWETAFAGVTTVERPEGEVIPMIRTYLHKNPANIRPLTEKNNVGVILDSRRWTFFNEAIVRNLGYNVNHETLRDFTTQMGKYYLGDSYALDFLKYLDDNVRFTVQDVVQGKATKADRDNAAELVAQILGLDFHALSKTELKNLITFIKTLDAEVRTALISNIITEGVSKTDGDDTKIAPYFSGNLKTLLTTFEKEVNYVKNLQA